MQWKQIKNAVSIIVTQNAPYYRATLELSVLGYSCRHISKSVRVSGPRTEISVDAPFLVRQVVLDPHFTVLHWTPEYRAEAETLARVTAADFDRIEGRRDQARKLFEAVLATVPSPDRFGVLFSAEVGLARVFIAQQNWAEAKLHLERAISAPVRPEAELPWAYYRLATVAAKTNNQDLLSSATAGAVNSDAPLKFPTGAGVSALALDRK